MHVERAIVVAGEFLIVGVEDAHGEIVLAAEVQGAETGGFHFDRDALALARVDAIVVAIHIGAGEDLAFDGGVHGDWLRLRHGIVLADFGFGFGNLRVRADPEGDGVAERGGGANAQYVLAERAIGRDLELRFEAGRRAWRVGGESGGGDAGLSRRAICWGFSRLRPWNSTVTVVPRAPPRGSR